MMSLNFFLCGLVALSGDKFRFKLIVKIAPMTDKVLIVGLLDISDEIELQTKQPKNRKNKRTFNTSVNWCAIPSTFVPFHHLFVMLRLRVWLFRVAGNCDGRQSWMVIKRIGLNFKYTRSSSCWNLACTVPVLCLKVRHVSLMGRKLIRTGDWQIAGLLQLYLASIYGSRKHVID